MPDLEPPARWTAWHLHLATPAVTALDRVVTDVVGPVVQDLGRPWFFVRYWQGGPHVRLRVADLEPGERGVVRARLEALLTRHGTPLPGEPLVDAEQYTAEAGRQARGETGGDRVVSGLHAPGVHQGSYEPELERYGGASVMAASEQLFHHSSTLVAQLVPALDLPRRRAVALRLAAASAQTLGDDVTRAVFFAIGRDSWGMWARSYGCSEEVLQRTRDVPQQQPSAVRELFDARPAWLSGWQDATARLVGALVADGHPVPGAVVSSHVHMAHNRLGLTTLDELRTYAVLAAADPAPQGAVPDIGVLAG